MRLVWDRSGWEGYTYWQTADRRILKRINTLIDACQRDPYQGIAAAEIKQIQIPFDEALPENSTLLWVDRCWRWSENPGLAPWPRVDSCSMLQSAVLVGLSREALSPSEPADGELVDPLSA